MICRYDVTDLLTNTYHISNQTQWSLLWHTDRSKESVLCHGVQIIFLCLAGKLNSYQPCLSLQRQRGSVHPGQRSRSYWPRSWCFFRSLLSSSESASHGQLGTEKKKCLKWKCWQFKSNRRNALICMSSILGEFLSQRGAQQRFKDFSLFDQDHLSLQMLFVTSVNWWSIVLHGVHHTSCCHRLQYSSNYYSNWLTCSSGLKITRYFMFCTWYLYFELPLDSVFQSAP